MYRRIFADPDIGDFFKKTDKEHLKARQKEFFAFVTGGAPLYKGKSMSEAHQGRGIHVEDFSKVATHMVATMRELGVAEGLISETVTLLVPLVKD